MMKDIWKFIILMCCRLLIGFPVQAQETVPDFVKHVENESMLVDVLLEDMEKHKENISFHYPGIVQDFHKYRKGKLGYQTFYDKLAKKNGYMMGIVSGSCIQINEQQKYVTFQICYLTSKRQEEYISTKVKKIAKQIRKGNRVTKIRKAHDYLVHTMKYDNRYYNPYFAFKKNRGMCMSYALAFQRIMQELNIPCIYVKGSNHAWNMVKVGKYWYNIDVTWDDSNGGYRYFLKCDKDFPGHKRPKTPQYQKLKKAKKSYR